MFENLTLRYLMPEFSSYAGSDGVYCLGRAYVLESVSVFIAGRARFPGFGGKYAARRRGCRHCTCQQLPESFLSLESFNNMNACMIVVTFTGM
jgi:hypothetical protein